MSGVGNMNENIVFADRYNYLSEAAHYSSRLILAILNINNLNKL